jgi:Uma2 family endonuclease
MSAPLRLTLRDYHAMIERGGFDPVWHKHIELIHGKLYQSPAPTPLECSVTSHLLQWLWDRLGETCCIRCRAPITIISTESEPEPDVLVAVEAEYGDRHPYPEDSLLVVQVSATTLDFDVTTKAELYARAGIVDYWVVDLVNRIVHVFREPSAAGYAVHERVTAGDVSPLAFPQVKLALAELFA